MPVSAVAVDQLIATADPKKVTVKVVSVADAVPTIRRLVPDGLTLRRSATSSRRLPVRA
ncbi:MAG TPA: hypothetical protein VEU28_08450 [Actinomycetota bacterium]|nr:hypothetical protein [Actinomycetota bacterium]